MIYTLALNPAIDRTMWVGKMDFRTTTRVRRESRYPGGKGVDVSRVLTAMGISNVALGFVGGFVGEELECRLGYEGVRTDMIKVSGETRTNIIVNETSNGRHLLLTAKGPRVDPYELGTLFRKIENLSDPTMMAVGGSLPRGIHPDTYRRVITIMKRKGAITILDADGENLRSGIEACPDYIKPNRHEMSELVGRPLSTLDEFIQAAEEVRSWGVGTVLVSLGPDGMMLVADGQRYLASPPKVDVVNSVGLGDSAVAGFMYGLANRLDLKDCLIHGTAAGTATAMKHGTARANKDDVMKIVPMIDFKNLMEDEK
ncbi:MAG: 1-phosphofructokinase [Euryarchaeota archaeon]|nr:1-phosphofructokinase [Euryarchaeota archaeon]